MCVCVRGVCVHGVCVHACVCVGVGVGGLKQNCEDLTRVLW